MATLKALALEFMDRFNTGDLDVVMGRFGETATFIDPQGVPHRGIQAIRAALAPIVEGSAGNARYTVMDTIIDEELSTASITWTLTLGAAGGAGSQMRGIDVLRFDGDKVVLKNCFMKAAELLVEDAPAGAATE